ncbi:hydrogenase maturation nickel metallochaperone HypA [bacterium]|nr:MAG: hydrogenase maturation nickel metallochaperone HypA [bacterium]RKZ16516.1 MAG: hydrogenase maturation nickel metallochaperone HypA [bacterium]
MHELSICQGLCTQLGNLAGEHGAERIRRVEVEVGAMSNVVPELLAHAFEAMRESVPLISEAELVIREIPLVALCDGCGEEQQLEQFALSCPGCGAGPLKIIQGEDLLLRQVELEIEEEVR